MDSLINYKVNQISTNEKQTTRKHFTKSKVYCCIDDQDYQDSTNSPTVINEHFLVNMISGLPPTLLISLRAFCGGRFGGRKKSERMQHFHNLIEDFGQQQGRIEGYGWIYILCSFSNWKVDSSCR